jgi:hypothetical protein
MKKTQQFAFILLLVTLNLGVAHAVTPHGKQVSSVGLAKGGSDVSFTWHAPTAATYKVHVQVPSDGTASNALYRVYPNGNIAGSTNCSSIDKKYPCFEISVNQGLINQISFDNPWIQLTLDKKTSTRWKFTSAGYVEVNPVNLVASEKLSVSAVSFEDTSSIFAIGKNYQGGIIFYLDETGKHGLIAAPVDQSTGSYWDSHLFSKATLTGSEIGTGKLNTASILATQNSEGYAAKLCDNLIIGRYKDWYLPSKDELNLMYHNIGRGAADLMKNIGQFSKGNYWTSSEYNRFKAWHQSFDNGNQNTYNKRTTFHVRAIRSF